MAKKAAGKKTTPPPTVEAILEECTKEVKKGLGVKRASKQAREYWLDEARKSVTAALANGGVWDKDKKNVLPTARKMGKVAAVLANGNIVLLWAAEAAAAAVQDDPRCAGAGQGAYCDF